MTNSKQRLVKGGRVVTSQAVLDADILIEGEKIAGILSPDTVGDVDDIIDATGCYVFPGIVDAHTHIMLDTGIYKTVDNWEIGTRAAAFGGVTTVVDFANQIPGATYKAALETRQAEATDATIDYAFHMVILEPDTDPDALHADFQRLMELGVTSIKLFTTYRPNYYVDDATILRIFRAMPRGMIAMVHCENDSIVSEATQRLVEQGKTHWRYHAQARPDDAEAEAVNRIVYLAGLALARVYVVHNSTAMATSAVNQMRQRGTGYWDKVFCETCPQYLLLHDDVYEGPQPEHFILQPPLRKYHHMESLRHYVEAGMIDVLSTDSCDYSIAQKTAQQEFTKTPGGLPGLETLLPLMYTTFHEKVGLPRLMQMLTENPARLFGLYPQKGVIAPGSDADLVIYDPTVETRIHAEAMHYEAGYNPFEGMAVSGQVRTVISRGETIVQGGAFYGKPGRGRFVVGGDSVDPFCGV